MAERFPRQFTWPFRMNMHLDWRGLQMGSLGLRGKLLARNPFHLLGRQKRVGPLAWCSRMAFHSCEQDPIKSLTN